MTPTAPNPPNPRFRILGVYLAIALTVWAGVQYYRTFIRYNLGPRNFGVVSEGKVYRSGRQTAGQLQDIVSRYGIKTIVDLGAFAPGSPEDERAARTARALGVDREVFILWGDGTGDPNRYVHALKLITDPARQPVLVHCATGAQRTSVCAIFYRTIVEGKSVDATYGEARDFKHSPRGNPKLKPYVDTWAEAVKKSFQTGQVIPYREAEGEDHSFPE